MPPNDERFLAYTYEELLVEWYEDQYETNPRAMFEFESKFDTSEDEPLPLTGDREMDEIDRRLLAGEDPDDVFAEWEADDPLARRPDDEVTEEIDDTYE